MKLFLILLLLTSALFAKGYKNRIHGVVREQGSNEPISYVNVYISNTTWGSSTDSMGYYSIDNIPPGNYELVCQNIGHSVKVMVITVVNDEDIKLNFRLKPLIYGAESIEIVAEDMKKWRKDLKKFKELFFGRNEYAQFCFITNELILDFTWKKGNLIAIARQPLQIVNNALSYKINCVLKEFRWNSKTNHIRWVVMNYFSEMESTNAEQKEYWLTNREYIYNLSMERFFKMLIKNNGIDNEYEIRRYHRLPGFTTGNTNRIHNQTWALDSKDPLSPWPVIPDSLIKPGVVSGEFILEFNEYLKVVHLEEGKTSFFTLLFNQATLDTNGFPFEAVPFEIYGYWGEGGIARMLPVSYVM